MHFLVTIFSLFMFHFIDIKCLSSKCETPAKLWTYYPCSFIISSPSFHCQQASISSSISHCINKEIIFFWHFPFGNMTITLESNNNQPFLLNLSKVLLTKRNLIKNMYHLIKNNNIEEEELLNNNDNKIITIHSNKYNQCTIKFETSDQIIFDYGTFIRMTVMTNTKNNNY